VDVPTLNAWTREARVMALTEVENEITGERMNASSVPGWQPAPPPAFSTLLGAPPQTDSSQIPSDGSGQVTASWVLSGLSFLALPIIPAIGALVLAHRAVRRGTQFAGAARAFSIIAIVLQCIAIAYAVRMQTGSV
jgi:hypothetical protein